jgi:wee1-like protein kinase
VYRATHRIDGCCYAIKRTKHPADTAEVHNRWLQEVQALSAAQAHPNIIRYFNAWAEPDMSGDHLYIQVGGGGGGGVSVGGWVAG